MASRSTRSDCSDGESSSASHANRGFVIATFIAGSAWVRAGSHRPRHYYATYPRHVSRLVEKPEKKAKNSLGGGPFIAQRGGCRFVGRQTRWENAGNVYIAIASA